MTVGHLDQWVVNAADPSTLARFWAFVLGGEAVTRPDGWAFVEGDRDAGRPRLSFQPDPAPKDGRNRIHTDVRVADIAAATESVLARGAERVGGLVTDAQGSFQVLRDPEGNEFCLVAPRAR
ncbi:putative enzyme related to lactoylglutathione lyase [Nocardiopsis sp. Huas11]|uniref:VOC family protein n=1 Tax=Nocardiopsis sp. Huas11 TaxID=2183912 RepID=UPI000EABC2D1|nr:VOC family protein [Nocardiopsis sp. Huas11]RKS06824.1 putative enzyme related to lactoylglutathione lyase [Nocardiopsis sp. Huas11]